MEKYKIGSSYVDIGNRIGKGGEGEVFKLNSHPDMALKIYKPNLRHNREAKVRAMVQSGLAHSTNLVAFPNQTVTNNKGSFAGFTMKLVKNYQPVHELYSPKSRRDKFPKADYRFLIRSAANLARSIAKVHDANCVVGDLNHSGILVSESATVALIDADSFQYKSGNQLYHCLVGVPDFTPPELHGQKLSHVIRNINHDHFGLAVAIFHLLMMGRHPYAGKYSVKDITLSESIAEHRFAYSLKRQNQTRTLPPPGAITLDKLPKHISEAFEYAFGKDPNQRPSAVQWVSLLSDYEKTQVRCSSVKSHYFPSSARKCLWCEMFNTSGIEMFADSLQQQKTHYRHIDLNKIFKQLEGLKLPNLSSFIPTINFKPKTTSKAVKQINNQKLQSNLAGIALAALAIGIFIFSADLWFISAFIGFWAFGQFNSDLNYFPLENEFEKNDKEAHTLFKSTIQSSGIYELYVLKETLTSYVNHYKVVDSNKQQELKNLKSQREQIQKKYFLEKFFIKNAKIHNIGPARKITLASYGVETAYDITQSKILSIPGFGPAKFRDLQKWRSSVESRFKYNPNPTPIDAQAERAVHQKYDKIKSDLENKIQKGFSDLQNGISKIKQMRSRLQNNQRLVTALEGREQAVFDLKQLGINKEVFKPDVSISSQYSYSQSAPSSSSSRSTNYSTYTPTQTSSSQSKTSNPTCPRCGSKMIKRLARRGRNRGNYFWGCSRYPQCKGTRNI